MTIFYRKQGDTYPPIETTLKNDDGTAISLASAEVGFWAKLRGGETTVFGSATVIDEDAGRVLYDIQSGDTDETGEFDVEWVITFSSGKVQHYPSSYYDRLIITPSIGGAS